MLPAEGKHIDSLSATFSNRISLDPSSNIPSNESVNVQIQTQTPWHINNIPDEIISHVFICLIASISIRVSHFPRSDSYRICLDLTKVCRRWRNIALDSPKFWSNIVYKENTNLKLIKLFLERSRNADLQLSFAVKEERGLPTDLLQLFFNQMHRVSFFKIIITSEERELIQDLLMQTGQRLRYLHLYNVLRGTLNLDFLSHSPLSTRLVEFNIKDVSLPWNSSIFQGLSSLTISKTRNNLFPRTISLSELLGILESCPMLRVLHLDEVQIDISENIQKRLVRLPHLDTLTFDYINSEAYLLLSDYIIVPKDINWNVKCNNFPIQPPWRFLPNFPERTGECKSYIITFSNGSLEFKVPESIIPYTSLCFTWDTRDIELENTLSTMNLLIFMTEAFIAQPYWSNPTELEIQSYCSYDVTQESFWSSILALFPRIRFLRVCDRTLGANVIIVPFRAGRSIHSSRRTDISKGLIGALTEPINCGTQLLTWLCPYLEKLEFASIDFSIQEEYQFYTRLVDHLQRRRDYGYGIHVLLFNRCSGIGEEEDEEMKRLNIAREIEVRSS